MTTIFSDGYFTTVRYVIDLLPSQLEYRLGLQAGSLGAGFDVGVPMRPLQDIHIELRGSTRWSDGKVGTDEKLPNGSVRARRDIRHIIESRSNMDQLRDKVSHWFKASAFNCPVKLFRPKGAPVIEYPDAGVGIPQFKTNLKVPWQIILSLKSGELLSGKNLMTALHP